MSRLYDNKPLSLLPVENVAWKAAWCPSQYQTGPGVLLEGCVRDRSRHVIVDSDGKRTRYAALYVCVRRAHRRRFDASGAEVEPNFSETEKVLLTVDHCLLISVITSLQVGMYRIENFTIRPETDSNGQ